MAKIVWLASYPKSGNTWVRFLLTALLTGRVTSSAQIARQIPDIHDGVAAHHLIGKGATLIKTHWKYWAEIPLREDTIGAIYVLRDPVEVMESNLNYAFMRSGNLRRDADEQEIAEFARRWVDSYIDCGGHRTFLEFGIGTWQENVSTWLATGKKFPHLLVRYEQLRANPEIELGRMARFLAVQRSAEQIAVAVKAASREAMREVEEREIANRVPGLFYQRRNQAGYDAGQRFVGRSRTGTSPFTLSEEQRSRARDRLATAIRGAGY